MPGAGVPLAPPVLFLAGLALAIFWLGAAGAMAQRVVLKDGRVFEGEFAMLSGVAVNPNGAGGQEMVKPIEMLDDGLVRKFFSKRNVLRIEPAPPQRFERFEIKQPIAENGVPIASVGPFSDVSDFDMWGRRKLTMSTSRGAAHIIQGLADLSRRSGRGSRHCKEASRFSGTCASPPAQSPAKS